MMQMDVKDPEFQQQPINIIHFSEEFQPFGLAIESWFHLNGN